MNRLRNSDITPTGKIPPGRAENQSTLSLSPKLEESHDGTDRLLNAHHLQQLLGMSRANVYRLMRDGTLPTVRINGCVRVPLRAFQQWVQDRTRPGRVAS
jgi:predicted DNA-binding transcriptional regulator AlpA